MARYEIIVDCEVGPLATAALEGFEATRLSTGHTRLVGDVVDQAAFHGLLNRLQDLHLEIIEIQRVDGEGAPDLSEVTR
jgi:hypothetical protein